VLQQTFKTNFDLRDLHRVQLAARPDDNWQRLTMQVEKLGSSYEAARPVYMANFAWQTFTWQEPGPDDESNRIKSWVHLKKKGQSNITDPHTLKLTVRLQKSNQLQAWWGKITNNYIITAQYIPFVRYLSTSVYLIILNVTLMLFSSSLVAYGISRLVWPGRDFVFMLMLATLMVPAQVTMIPGFLVWKNLGAYNTLVPLWLGSAFGGAFNIFLLRQFMRGIPMELSEAAKIDGASEWRIWWSILVPLSKAGIATVAIFQFQGAWQDFMGPLIYLQSERFYTLQLGLRQYEFAFGGSPAWNWLMAASLIVMLPVLIIFVAFQRYFIEGVTLTGMKG
jgi:multiple sugar transport system permease protein